MSLSLHRIKIEKLCRLTPKNQSLDKPVVCLDAGKNCFQTARKLCRYALYIHDPYSASHSLQWLIQQVYMAASFCIFTSNFILFMSIQHFVNNG